MTVYGAGILDVMGSKSVANREVLQDRLNEAIGEFNKAHGEILPVPAGITVGDEWEFLTDRPGEAYAIIQWFQEALRPDGVRIYAGLGLGTLSTPLAPEIRQMDGACFHLARRALAIAKGYGGRRHKFIHSKRNRIYLLAGEEAVDPAAFSGGLETASASEDDSRARDRLTLQEIANALIENTEILKSRISRKQRQTMFDYERFGSYRKMAEASGIGRTPGGISQKLNAAEYFTIRRNERLIAILLALLARGVSL